MDFPAARCKEILVFTNWIGLWSILWREMLTSLYKFFFGFLKSLTFYIMICYSFTTQGDCKIFNFKSLNAPFSGLKWHCIVHVKSTVHLFRSIKIRVVFGFLAAIWLLKCLNTIVSIKCALHQFKKNNFCFDDKL